MVLHWSLSNSKSPQVSRTLLSILAILNNVVVWMVSTHPPTSKSSSPFSNPLVTIPNAPITIGIFVTCMFHSFIIIIIMDTATQVQILDKNDCISHSTNILGKGMNPIILPPAMGK